MGKAFGFEGSGSAWAQDCDKLILPPLLQDPSFCFRILHLYLHLHMPQPVSSSSN